MSYAQQYRGCCDPKRKEDLNPAAISAKNCVGKLKSSVLHDIPQHGLWLTNDMDHTYPGTQPIICHKTGVGSSGCRSRGR